MVHRSNCVFCFVIDDETSYQAGYNACLEEFTRHLMAVTCIDYQTKTSLLNGISKLSKQNLNKFTYDVTDKGFLPSNQSLSSNQSRIKTNTPAQNTIDELLQNKKIKTEYCQQNVVDNEVTSTSADLTCFGQERTCNSLPKFQNEAYNNTNVATGHVEVHSIPTRLSSYNRNDGINIGVTQSVMQPDIKDINNFIPVLQPNILNDQHQKKVSVRPVKRKQTKKKYGNVIVSNTTNNAAINGFNPCSKGDENLLEHNSLNTICISQGINEYPLYPVTAATIQNKNADQEVPYIMPINQNTSPLNLVEEGYVDVNIFNDPSYIYADNYNFERKLNSPNCGNNFSYIRFLQDNKINPLAKQVATEETNCYWNQEAFIKLPINFL